MSSRSEDAPGVVGTSTLNQIVLLVDPLVMSLGR
jgi:hypothetical protein